MAYKAPKAITKHPAVAECKCGLSAGAEYRHQVQLKDGWTFSSGYARDSQRASFRNIPDFQHASPRLKFSAAFKTAFQSTYQVVGSDVEQSMEGPEYAKMDYDERDIIMAETVLDANRMQMYGGPDGDAADKELRDLCAIHGWSPVVEQAAKQFL